ncbi:MAG: FAD-dependent oxidoreductase [Gammaproteobacteria bacterium]|nr:FAD-dependent oxidoreductase [Gammaproteobacteria bacterium]
MARIVILGAGVAGHTAARYLGRLLPKEHEIIIVTPNSKWNWIPSNIWVGVGEMKPEQVTFELAPVYKKLGVHFCQAKALSIHPEGGEKTETPYVTVQYTDPLKIDDVDTIEYDYLVNATGPKLNFAATEGLGPENGFSASVCTPQHAVEANKWLQKMIIEMKSGKTKTFVIGTGHGMCTCQGAAFEYIYNVEHTLREAKVRDKARLIWLSNEYELGDFGMGGIHLTRGGYITNGKVFSESLMVERGMEWITRAHVTKVEKDKIHYETLDGEYHELDYDFTMLIPPFAGVGLKAFDKAGEDITDKLFAPNALMKVDGDYRPKPYDEWHASDWPRTYQTPFYKNIFAAGIAFAPPHLISKPMQSANGTPINPTPPRTGMPSANIGKAVALSIRDMINGSESPTHTASMSEMGAACVASTGMNLFKGTAATMTVYPVVPDYEKYPVYGRDMSITYGEIGLAGHWMKYALHHMFMYQAQLKPGWSMIPD